MSTNYDHEYDVIVVGSGNGALTSAICSHDGGAKVLVIEKSNQFGGTSATSGGEFGYLIIDTLKQKM